VGLSRKTKPDVAVATQERAIKGRADELPKAGMQLGERVPLAPPYPVVANFPTHAEIAALVRESVWAPAANLVLLDPNQADGYLRQWQPPGFPPIRHIAYAVQWFSLAAALVVIYFVTNLRRATKEPA
jgi:surfeit locus 1 family protein